MVVTVLLLAGCGSGSTSRGAEGITGSTTVSEEPQAIQLDEKGGKGKGNSGTGNPGKGGGKGNHRGRPEAKLEGVVTAKSGACKGVTLTVAGTTAKANGATKFEPNCAAVVVGASVKVEGQPLGNGQVLARKIQVLAGPAGPVVAPPGTTGALVGIPVQLGPAGPIDPATDGSGKFEFKNVAAGNYTVLDVTLPGPVVCPLAMAITVGPPPNEIEGHLFTNAVAPAPTTCASIVLAGLQVEQGPYALSPARVQLVSGATVVEAVTSVSGAFKILNSPPGVYALNLVQPFACPLTAGINVVAQSNRVGGTVVSTVSPPVTCADIVLQKLEVKQGS
jgi:hypothetical protein